MFSVMIRQIMTSNYYTISLNIEMNCAGHSTLDALASRPVAYMAVQNFPNKTLRTSSVNTFIHPQLCISIVKLSIPSLDNGLTCSRPLFLRHMQCFEFLSQAPIRVAMFLCGAVLLILKSE